MSAPALPRGEFALLDRMILEALWDLRAARSRAERSGSRRNLELCSRAEEHLDALLDYRHAARVAPAVGTTAHETLQMLT
ncbi:hypothetical protein [Blastococcus litoris]|uniref:hypothetical protein n=1 Tax=Blastococcus litoris TaxID=2171622 RepID=UPI000E3085D2|nr:hypothetical protein [Blastococcus litoris]